jgi:hypothetical protein
MPLMACERCHGSHGSITLIVGDLKPQLLDDVFSLELMTKRIFNSNDFLMMDVDLAEMQMQHSMKRYLDTSTRPLHLSYYFIRYLKKPKLC